MGERTLKPGEALVVMASIGLLGDLFLPWYKIEDQAARTGWQGPGALWSGLLGVIAVAFICCRASLSRWLAMTARGQVRGEIAAPRYGDGSQ
jgi:hypothetical protein